MKNAIVYTRDFPWEEFALLLPAHITEGTLLRCFSNHAMAVSGIASLRALDYSQVLYVCNTYYTGEQANSDWLLELQELLELTPSRTRVRIVPFEPDFHSVVEKFLIATGARPAGKTGNISVNERMVHKEEDPLPDQPFQVDNITIGIKDGKSPAGYWKSEPKSLKNRSALESKGSQHHLLRLPQVQDSLEFFQYSKSW
jgi:hypothetical protein